MGNNTDPRRHRRLLVRGPPAALMLQTPPEKWRLTNVVVLVGDGLSPGTAEPKPPGLPTYRMAIERVE